MGQWEVWELGGGSACARASTHSDRVEALAAVFVARVQGASRRPCWVTGSGDVECGTDGDFEARVVGSGEQMNAAGRELGEFLRAWWAVSRVVAAVPALDLDTAVAMIAAAAVIEPPELPEGWRTTDRPFTYEFSSYEDWETLILSQIADLADFADAGPLSDQAYFGIDVPRPAGVVRATGGRWYNFSPIMYLDCGTRGALPKRRQPGSPLLNWSDLADIAFCGQIYE